jgi:hypothetical protein
MTLTMLLPVGACHQSEMRSSDPSDMQTGSEGNSADFSGAGVRAAWTQLRRDMTSDEVLVRLGEPVSMKVEMMFTYWYYSPRRERGPYVYFATRPMTVIGWREP